MSARAGGPLSGYCRRQTIYAPICLDLRIGKATIPRHTGKPHASVDDAAHGCSPQTNSVCPVTNDAFGSVKKVTARATSSGVPNRPTGTCFAAAAIFALRGGMISSNISVSAIGPGATTFDGDSVGGEFERPGAGQPQHAGFGRRIGRALCKSQHGARGNQHDPAVVRLLHGGQIGLHQRQRRRRDADCRVRRDRQRVASSIGLFANRTGAMHEGGRRRCAPPRTSRPRGWRRHPTNRRRSKVKRGDLRGQARREILMTS